jgi:hypothetical protein
MSLPIVLRAGILCGVAAGAIALAAPSTAQRIMVDGTPQTVWSWSASTKCDGGNDFPDVPARPFLVGSKVLWFASNSGRYASVGTGGVDILATPAARRGPGIAADLRAMGRGHAQAGLASLLIRAACRGPTTPRCGWPRRSTTAPPCMP